MNNYIKRFVRYTLLFLSFSCNQKNEVITDNQILELSKNILNYKEFQNRIDDVDQEKSDINVYSTTTLNSTLFINGRNYCFKQSDSGNHKKPYMDIRVETFGHEKNTIALFFYPLKADGVIGIIEYEFKNGNYKIIDKKLGHMELNLLEKNQ